MNDYYKILRKRLIEVIDSDKTFSELKESSAYSAVIHPVTSLYSSAESLDGTWEDCIQPALVRLREEIADKDLFENNSEIHKADVAVSLFLGAISMEIDTMRKHLAQETKNFYGALPNEKAGFDNAFKKQGAEDVIKHEVRVALPEDAEIIEHTAREDLQCGGEGVQHENHFAKSQRKLIRREQGQRARASKWISR